MKNLSEEQILRRVTSLKNYFLNRTDILAARMSWNKPCPVEGNEHLDRLLCAHVVGAMTLKAVAKYQRGDGSFTSEEGYHRLGAYSPDPDGHTRWLCLDFDGGAGHADPLADPLAAALFTLGRGEALGLPVYLERSGSGQGWHVWMFFAEPVPAREARRLGFALIPQDAFLTAGGLADVHRSRGIEVFPKQDSLKDKSAYGNMVWLPWWSEAPEGANEFYRLEDDKLVAFVPDTFEAASSGTLASVLAAISAKETTSPATGRLIEVGQDLHSTEQRIKEALTFIDSTPYDQWLRIGMALNSWDSGARGFELFDQWSMRSENYGETKEKWDSFAPDGGVGLGTLFKLASDKGWRPHERSSDPTSKHPENDEASSFTTTDLANARRFSRQHGDKLRHCVPLGGWLHWDGQRWQQDETGVAIRCAKQTVESIYQEIAPARQVDRDSLYKWARISQSRSKIEDTLKLAQSEPPFPIFPGQVDSDPWALNVLNGVLDLRTGTLQPHRPDDLFMKLVPVAFDASATAPLWNRFLEDITLGDQELAAYLQRAVGYSLTGVIREHALFVLHGTKGNDGKSTFLRTIGTMLGSYAAVTLQDLLVAKSHEDHPTRYAPLCGARFAVSSEANEGDRFNVALLKMLTGGDMITTRLCRGDCFSFQPTHKFWMGVNSLPGVPPQDEAFWRRLRLVPMRLGLTDSDTDKRLGEKLAEEYPGILAWAFRGCLEWQRRGLDEPMSVLAARDELRGRGDHMAKFIRECCRVEAEVVTASEALYAAYCEHCVRRQQEPKTQTAFGRSMGEWGFASARLPSSNCAARKGIALVCNPEPALPEGSEGCPINPLEKSLKNKPGNPPDPPAMEVDDQAISKS